MTIGLGLLKDGDLHMTKYVLNGANDQDDIWWHVDEYNSYEDAELEAMRQYDIACNGEETDLFEAGTKDTVPDYCYIGEKQPFDYRIDGNDIIEMIQDSLACCGLESAAEMFDDAPSDDVNDLTDIMTDAFITWCATHCYNTDIYQVVNIKNLYVGDAE